MNGSRHDAEMVSAPDPVPPEGGAVKSAARALQVLELFEELRRPVRATEVATALGMPQSSTSMLMRSLRDLGYLDYDRATRTYLPSPRVTLLGSWLAGGPVRDGRLIRMMEHLTDRTGKTSLLAARNGIFAQYIYTMPSRSTMRFHISLGARRLLAGSAAGLALLRDEEDDEIRSLVRRTAAEVPGFEATANDVLENVRLVRSTGRFLSRGMVTPGAGALAMPLPPGLDLSKRPLALVLAGLMDELSRDETMLAGAMAEAVERFVGGEVGR